CPFKVGFNQIFFGNQDALLPLWIGNKELLDLCGVVLIEYSQKKLSQCGVGRVWIHLFISDNPIDYENLPKAFHSSEVDFSRQRSIHSSSASRSRHMRTRKFWMEMPSFLAISARRSIFACFSSE